MNKKVIGIITYGESDILDIIRKSGIETVIMKPEEIGKHDLGRMSSMAILGGVNEKPLLFCPRERVIIEKYLKSGKKIFSEYCSSIGYIYSAPPESTRFERLAFCMEEGIGEILEMGDILDDQCNTRIKPYDFACSKRRPILQYVKVKEHSKAAVDDKLLSAISDRALWFDDPESLLVCNFRIANFVKARFSPACKWRSLVKYILEWLYEENISVDVLRAPYQLKPFNESLLLNEQVQQCIENSISWFNAAEMLVNEGKDGVKEGLAAEIYADGTQRVLEYIRGDCTGETSLAFFMHYLLTKDAKSKDISRNLISVCFDFKQKKEEGPLKGMLRWTQEAWEVCYQDDAARVVISQLLKCLYTGLYNNITKADYENTYIAKPVYIDPPAATGVKPFVRTDYTPDTSLWGYVVSKDTKNPEICAAILDLIGSEETANTYYWGWKGETYKVGADGKKEYIPDFINMPKEESEKKYGIMTYPYAIVPMFSMCYVGDAMMASWCDESRKGTEIAARKLKSGEYDSYYAAINPTLDDDATEKYSTLSTAVRTYVNETLTAFVLGGKPMSEWDKFVNSVQEYGDIDWAVEQFNKAPQKPLRATQAQRNYISP